MSKQYPNPPALAIDPNKKYTATFTTSRGEIVCELFASEAPKTVNNFVFLARDKFYDGTKFHRVIENFMVQGGDPEGTGRGGPGYRFEDETKGNPTNIASAPYPWPTPAPTPTAASSSSPTSSPTGSTENTPFSGRSRAARTSSTPSSRAT